MLPMPHSHCHFPHPHTEAPVLSLQCPLCSLPPRELKSRGQDSLAANLPIPPGQTEAQNLHLQRSN